MAHNSARDTFIAQLSTRIPNRTEADIQADICGLLAVGGLNIGQDQARIESQTADGTQRRIDVEIGQLAIEVKKDLRIASVREKGEQQLAGYVATRSEQLGAHYSGILTASASSTSPPELEGSDIGFSVEPPINLSPGESFFMDTGRTYASPPLTMVVFIWGHLDERPREQISRSIG